MSSTLYMLCLTFWMRNGEIVHTKTQARFHTRNITKPVSSYSQCKRIAADTQLKYENVCSHGNICEKVTVICEKTTKEEFFSKHSSHRKHHIEPNNRSKKKYKPKRNRKK